MKKKKSETFGTCDYEVCRYCIDEECTYNPQICFWDGAKWDDVKRKLEIGGDTQTKPRREG